MKKLFIILILICGVVSCEKAKDTEFPLILPAAAEQPSATMYNDRGIDFYREGDYQEAAIAFVQARTADHTAGEIHFNLALTRLKLDEKDEARKSFKLAKTFLWQSKNPGVFAFKRNIGQNQKIKGVLEIILKNGLQFEKGCH